MDTVLLAIAVIVSAIFLVSVVSLAKHITRWRWLQVFGSTCLVVVVLTHIAERQRLWPQMGWGLPNSAGHYIDLVSASVGCITLPLGFFADAFSRRRASK